MSAIARTLSVSRSNLIERTNKPSKPRGSYRKPDDSHRLAWLSDNSSAYIARQTAQVAAALGVNLLFTPVRSPQSNGISKAFVKTLKRDYASTVPDADTILALLRDWIDDYCEVHPALRAQVPLTTRPPTVR